jgi:ribosomal protein S18 acetylase RimI-like enzyme
MENNVIIRDAEERDFPVLGQIYAEAFNTADVGEDWKSEDAEKLLRCLSNHKPSIFLAAEADNKVVAGFIGIIKPYYGQNDLCDTELFVDPSYQNVGVGKKLLVEMLNRGIKNYQIVGFQGIADSLKEFPGKWYLSLGFKPTRWVHHYGIAQEMLEKLNKS